MGILYQVDFDQVGRLWGPLGVGFVLFILLALGVAKLAQKIVISTIEDARKDRDAARAQADRHADKFVESLKIRDDLMREGFDEVLREIRTRRK